MIISIHKSRLSRPPWAAELLRACKARLIVSSFNSTENNQIWFFSKGGFILPCGAGEGLDERQLAIVWCSEGIANVFVDGSQS